MSFISLSVVEVLIPSLSYSFSFQLKSLALRKDHDHFKPCVILIPTKVPRGVSGTGKLFGGT